MQLVGLLNWILFNFCSKSLVLFVRLAIVQQMGRPALTPSLESALSQVVPSLVVWFPELIELAHEPLLYLFLLLLCQVRLFLHDFALDFLLDVLRQVPRLVQQVLPLLLSLGVDVHALPLDLPLDPRPLLLCFLELLLQLHLLVFGQHRRVREELIVLVLRDVRFVLVQLQQFLRRELLL